MPEDASLASRFASADLMSPSISLHGSVDDDMLTCWLEGMGEVRAGGGALTVEITTTGGDAEVGRRIADDVRLFREQTGRRTLFLGKTAIYSAGATIMGGFLKADRWLTRDAVVMVHGRKLTKCKTYENALRAERAGVVALLEEIDAGIEMERVEFAKFIEGSDIDQEEIERRTLGDWYIPAEEALRRGLIAGLV